MFLSGRLFAKVLCLSFYNLSALFSFCYVVVAGIKRGEMGTCGKDILVGFLSHVTLILLVINKVG